MATYILKLWAHTPDAGVPTVEVEADDEMTAAALGLKHFAQMAKRFLTTAPSMWGSSPSRSRMC